MPSFHARFAVFLATLAAGCGGRAVVDEAAPFDTPRVDDCARRTPDAVPLGRIAPSPDGGGASGFGFAADEAFAYFYSEGRIWRVAKASGAPEPITPPGTGGGGIRLHDGSLFWSEDDAIFRAPASGGDPEYVGTAPAGWTISGQDLITVSGLDKGASVTRTPFGGGSSEEILAGDPGQQVHLVAGVGDGVLVKRTADLLLIPASGPLQTLADAGTTGFARLLEDGGFVYFGGFDADFIGVFRVPADGSAPPQTLLEGIPIATAIAGDTLYANVILRQPDNTFVGTLVRLPRFGGAFTAMTTTDAFALGTPPPGSWPAVAHQTGGLEADASRVYFIELCTDLQPAEYRLVSLPAYHVASP